MRTQNYTIRGLFSNRELQQFIVPEIQRDYVWETGDVDDLLDYIREGFEGGDADLPYLGFIYAYGDRDFVYKYFLIDGQQRLTTIILLLIAAYAHLEKKMPNYLFDRELLKFDYKVRQSTQDFLMDLVGHCREGVDASNFIIEDQIWYHNDYKNDRSIKQMISNFTFIRKWLTNFRDVEAVLNYIEDKVEISYYDIADGRQGEDLYIYMNSRGRHLEPNETLKAKYLSRVEDKKYWGAEWERWQDLFWKFRLHRPDADEGFNDFLKMVQIIEMSKQDKGVEEISAYARGASSQLLMVEKLPEQVEDLKDLFEAYEWLVKSSTLKSFFKVHEREENYFLLTPPAERAQIFYFRLLPVLLFLAETGCRDDSVILRFVRFFYNLSRKRDTVGKDIGSQLVIAIRLMQEYSLDNRDVYDVCQLLAYRNRRTTLLDTEEVHKLSLYENPPNGVSRSDLEDLFWEVEDHKIFEGQIGFFLWRYLDVDTSMSQYNLFLASWGMFKKVFSNESEATIVLALLQYGNTWIRKSPFYYLNYDCTDWNAIVQIEDNFLLIQLIEDLALNGWKDLNSIIVKKSKEYMQAQNYITVAAIKEEIDFYKQVKTLAILDYFNGATMFKQGKSHVANDQRYNCKVYGDPAFFNNQIVIHNIRRYIDNGENGRIIRDLNSLLSNEDKLQMLIDQIIAVE